LKKTLWSSNTIPSVDWCS